MSWIIDDLNNQNIQLRRENNTKQFKFNRLVKDYSDLVSALDKLNSQLDDKDKEIIDLTERLSRYEAIVKEIGQDVKAVYPNFTSRLKFLLKG